RMPAVSSRIERVAESAWTLRHPTRRAAESSCARLGRRPVRRALRHSATNGPTVISKAPSDCRASARARVRTANSGSLTGTAMPGERPFWIGKTEVTWDEYDIWAFRLDLTPRERSSGVDATARPSRPYGAPDRGFGHHGYPALAMTYFAAQTYCAWLSVKTGKKYRLPT